VFADVILKEHTVDFQRLELVERALEEPDSRVPFDIHIVLAGTTADGTPVRSNEFVLPVELCRGCLLVPCEIGQVVRFEGCHPGQDDGLSTCE
jgi:hypothetical protein